MRQTRRSPESLSLSLSLSLSHTHTLSLPLSLHSLRWSCYVRTAGPGRCRSSWASPGPGPPPFVPASWLENSAAGDGKVSVDTANFSTCLSGKALARRSGGAEGAAARSNGVADGPDRRASRWLCRVMSCRHACDERLACSSIVPLDWEPDCLQSDWGA